jgi:[acyl-carrier-protein] S-malonyltransferase
LAKFVKGGERVVAATTAAAKLAAQVLASVDWATALKAEFGATRVLDLGPGHALAEIARSALPDVRCYPVDAY